MKTFIPALLGSWLVFAAATVPAEDRPAGQTDPALLAYLEGLEDLRRGTIPEAAEAFTRALADLETAAVGGSCGTSSSCWWTIR